MPRSVGLTRGTAIALALLGAAAGGGCGKKKSPQTEPEVRRDEPPDAATPAGKHGQRTRPVKQHLSLEERRRRLLATAPPEMVRKSQVYRRGEVAKLEKPQLRSLADGTLMVGTIKVNRARGRAEVPATITLRPGELIEYFAVAPGGKTHETVVTANTSPVHLRLALTLIGLHAAAPSRDKPAPVTAASSVQILVRVPDGKGGTREVPATSLTRDRATNRPLDSNWQVTGYAERRAEMIALGSTQLVATRYDYATIINAATDTGNPYRTTSSGLVVGNNVPPVGTTVDLIFVGTPAKGAGPTPGKASTP